MSLPTRETFIGMALGALCASAVAAIGPGFVLNAFADEASAGIDVGNLVKFDGRDYRVDYADWVSTDPISTFTIKKIEAGRVKTVVVTTTATGTYSTDGLISRHVRYPGIEVQEIKSPAPNQFAYWQGDHWAEFAGTPGKSFVSLRTNGTIQHVTQ